MDIDIRKRFQEKDEERKEVQRTMRQNKALHVLFRLLAEQLNEAGLDQRKVLKPGVDIPWTDKSIKEQIWKPVQKAQLNKGSTTQLTTTEIDKVFDTINKHMGEKFGLHVPFPSIETILDKEREAQR
jgi:hypothetical protein